MKINVLGQSLWLTQNWVLKVFLELHATHWSLTKNFPTNSGEVIIDVHGLTYWTVILDSHIGQSL